VSARRSRRRGLTALAAVVAVVALLSGCSLAPFRPHDRHGDRSGLPTLSVRAERIEPFEVVYRDEGKTRRPARGHGDLPTVTLRRGHDLRMRVVSGYPARELRVGTFSRADGRGSPVDGGDQFDCLAESDCTVETRAGSVHISVPLAAAVRLVIVRETFALTRGATLEMVWRFRVSRAES